jgi:predicted acylesterase/phospholipase RssA/CRP-like cAMP-binding protein
MTTGLDLKAMLRLDGLGAELERVTLPAGAVLYREGDCGDAAFFVESGRLAVSAAWDGGEPLSLGTVLPGESAGELQLLSGGHRTATVVAAVDSVAARLPVAVFRKAAAAMPELLPLVAEIALRRVRRRQLAVGLRRLCGPLDDARLREVEGMVEWVRLPRGAALVNEGDAGDDVFILVSGRLRAVRESDAGPVILGDIAQGESVGEMVFFTGERRSATVLATRDSELVRFSGAEFDALLRSDHDVARRVTRLVVDRLRRIYAGPAAPPIRSIAVLPASLDAPAEEFARKLAAALAAHGPTRRLDGAAVDRELGPGACQISHDDPLGPGVDGWLDEIEAAHRFVVYAADPVATGWSGRCVARADQVLLVAHAGADPARSELEDALLPPEAPATAASRVLILLHDAAATLPVGTAAWLEPRELDAHHHFRGEGDAEFARLARFVAGRAVGVVLGGGGARGFAHIGVLDALQEAGVPVDLIGGTSMGASIAAQHAMGWDSAEMLRRNRAAWLDLEPHKEYTLPLLSILKGRKAAIMGRMLYGDVRIEDLWTPFYCVSTNLTRAEQRVHRRGTLCMAATASASLPAIVTPVVDGGDLLVDGAILNNLPVDVMREVGAGVILAVDVSAEEDLAFPDEAFPTPWSLLRDRLLRRPRRKVPNIGEVVLRCTMLGSVNRGAATQGLADYYLRPPLEKIGLMEFTALDESAAIGRGYTLETIEAWRETPLFGRPG